MLSGVCVCVCVCVCICVFVSVSVCLFVYVCMIACLYVFMFLWLCSCMYVLVRNKALQKRELIRQSRLRWRKQRKERQSGGAQKEFDGG